jgi:hypothetical protein
MVLGVVTTLKTPRYPTSLDYSVGKFAKKLSIKGSTPPDGTSFTIHVPQSLLELPGGVPWAPH